MSGDLAILGDYPDFDPKGPTVSSLISTLRIPKELSVGPEDSKAVIYEPVGGCISPSRRKASTDGGKKDSGVIPSFALGGRTASGCL